MISKNPEISQKICPTCFLELSISESNRNRHDSCGSEISDSEISDSEISDSDFLASEDGESREKFKSDLKVAYETLIASMKTSYHISREPVSEDQRAKNILGYPEATAADLEMAEDLGLV